MKNAIESLAMAVYFLKDKTTIASNGSRFLLVLCVFF